MGGDKHGNMLSYSNNAEVHDVRILQGCTAALGWGWASLRMSSHSEVSDGTVSEKQTLATLNATLHCKKRRFLLLWHMMVMDDLQGVMKHTQPESTASVDRRKPRYQEMAPDPIADTEESRALDKGGSKDPHPKFRTPCPILGNLLRAVGYRALG